MVRPVHSKRKLFNNNKEQKENEPEGSVRNVGPNNSGRSTRNNYTHNHNNNQSSHNIGAHSTSNLNVGINISHGKVENSEDVGTTPCTPVRPVMPMSERQQIALLRQMSSPSPSDKADVSRSSSPRTPNTPNLGRGVNKRNDRGETPLHVASIKGDTDRVSQLISQGADVNATDYAGWSALHEACNRGFYGVSKLLIDAGADVNAKGLDNDTPLHDACVNNHFKLVRLLLKCGAGVDVVNRRGKSPRDVSRSPGIVSLIEQAAKGNLENLGTSSGEDIAPQAADLYKRMSRRTPPATKASDDKPGGPGSPRVTLRLQTGVSRTPDKPRQHDKNNMDEDVYEFKLGKDESGKGSADAEAKGCATTEEKESAKRIREGAEDSDEDAQSKRRKEDKESSQQHQQQHQQQQQQQQQQGATKGSTTEKGGKSNNGLTTAQKATANSNVGSSSSSSSNISASGTVGALVSSGDKKSPMTSAANSPKPTTTKTGESSDTEDDVKSESSSGAGPKVPPLKIVLGGATEAEQSTRNGKNNISRLPYVVNTTGEEKDGQTDSKEGIVQVKIEDANSNSNSSNGSGSEKGSGSRITRSRGGNNTASEEDTKPIKAEIKVESPPPPPVAQADHIIHPRKRKIKIKEAEMDNVKREPASTTTTEQPVNCYETFLKIRKQIERRRESLRPVQPKPPQDFENYLMNRCTYVLAGNASSRLSVPVITPPSSLAQPLKDLFNDQEKERYRLRLQHLIEKEKLVLSVEQEILRVHGRAARALANQALPFSVCTLLKDEEVYNIISPEQEKDGNARSRYNGRLFLSWLQDVDDKWEKIKEHMVLRHHHEAESLHAVQRMDWEWKLKELRLIENNQRPTIDDVQVPQVQVSDDFDLLPA